MSISGDMHIAHITRCQLRQIIRETLEARSIADPRALKTSVRRSIDKIIDAYSSITDEDVAAFEELGIFKLAKTSGSMLAYVKFDYKVLNFLDDISDVKPLYSIFLKGEFISVDELESKLNALSTRPDMDVFFSDAAQALPALLKHVRKIYTQLLAKSEAEPEDPLGRIAFANNRKGMPLELDTKLEDRLRGALIDHFEGSAMLSKENAQLIQDLMAQGMYPSIFSEPTAPILVRGMSVSSKWLAGAIGRQSGGKGSAEVNFTFVPKKGVSSWTTSKSVAKGFHMLGSNVNIVLYASTADNPGKFLSVAPGLYSTDFVSGRFKKEKESLGLGPIKVFKIDWAINDV